MARVSIPVDFIPANGGAVSLTGVAADPANDHQVTNDQQTFVLGINQNVASKTATIVSVSDAYGRTGDVTMTMPAAAAGFNGVAVAGPFLRPNWNQGGGSLLNIDTAAAAVDVKFFAFRFIFS